MLKEISCADAFGNGFKKTSKEFIAENSTKLCYLNNEVSELELGQYSDDTQMSIAVTLYLLQIENDEYSATELVDYFLGVYDRDRRNGYAKELLKILEEATSAYDFVRKTKLNQKTTSSNGVIRACPIGLHPNKEFVKTFSKFQAEITNRDSTVLAAQAVALSVFYFKNLLGFPSDLPKFLNRELGTNIDWIWNDERLFGRDHLGLITAHAAISTVITTRAFSDCLIKAVSYGVEPDSVASIAAGISSVNTFHDHTIPESLILGLEPSGEFGFDYCSMLDDKLKEKFGCYEKFTLATE